MTNQNAKVNQQRRAYDSLFFQRCESTLHPLSRQVTKHKLQPLGEARAETVYRVWVLIAIVGLVRAQESMDRSTWYTFLRDMEACGISWGDTPYAPRRKSAGKQQ